MNQSDAETLLRHIAGDPTIDINTKSYIIKALQNIIADTYLTNYISQHRQEQNSQLAWMFPNDKNNNSKA